MEQCWRGGGGGDDPAAKVDAGCGVVSFFVLMDQRELIKSCSHLAAFLRCNYSAAWCGALAACCGASICGNLPMYVDKEKAHI